jgi:hypothetical protein
VTEEEWAVILAAGLQAEHQAIELICRPRTLLEWRDLEVVRLHRWAVALLADLPGPRDAQRRHA